MKLSTNDLVKFTEDILNGKLHFLRTDGKFSYISITSVLMLFQS